MRGTVTEKLMTNDPLSFLGNNIGYQCSSAHCDAGRGNRLAMRWISASMERTDYTFADLDALSNRFANALQELGLCSGDVLFTFLPRMPEQFVALLGSLKLTLLTGTLFANFGDEALLDRLGDSRAGVVVTKRSFLKKLRRIRQQLPSLKIVILVDDDTADGSDGIYSYQRLLESSSSCFLSLPTLPETPSLLHYTSGSTGKPKGVVHCHRSIQHQLATSRDILELGEDDIFWCTADQGWVTGTSYGVIGPWSLGVTQVHYGGGYDSQRWMEILEQERVSVWYTAPTALRMLMRESDEHFSAVDLHRLKAVYSVGEPLNPEVIQWGRRVLGREIYDTWFQTETGGIMISNHPQLPVRPGSMGRAVEGVTVAICDESGDPLPSGKTGNLCIKPGWPSMFSTYLNNGSVYRQKFRGGWYFTGDSARMDADGYVWFQGRTDDVINTGGHLISPFEIESALLEIDEIAESGAIAVPDETLFEAVVVYVTLHHPFELSTDLELKIRLHLSNRVSTLATPREVRSCPSIPKNKSGKIMRRVLKARYLGQDEGDLSTLDD